MKKQKLTLGKLKLNSFQTTNSISIDQVKGGRETPVDTYWSAMCEKEGGD